MARNKPDIPCGGNCFAVQKLLNKLEKEVEVRTEEAEFWKRRASYWKAEYTCRSPLAPKVKKRKRRDNPGYLKVVN